MRGDALGPLHGLPLAVKDTQDVGGMRTTYGSPLFAEHVPAADAGSVARLRAAGAIIVGKTNTPEWAAGANTRNPVYGATGNPFDPLKSCAGSSGGAAVALACGMTPLATGSDTGGSLRNPAGFCGIVGMRPSYGLVASERRLHGWSSLSTDGPMARNVSDAALMLSSWPATMAATRWPIRCRENPCERSRPAGPSGDHLKGLRLAFTEDFGFAPTEQQIRRVFRSRVAALAPHFATAEEAGPDCTGADDAFAVLRASMFLSMFEKIHAEKPTCWGRT